MDSCTITRVVRYTKHGCIIMSEWITYDSACTQNEKATRIMSFDITLLRYHCVIKFKFTWLAVAIIKNSRTPSVQVRPSNFKFFLFFIEVAYKVYVFDYFLTQMYLWNRIFSWKRCHSRFWRLSLIFKTILQQMYRRSVLYMKLLSIIKNKRYC